MIDYTDILYIFVVLLILLGVMYSLLYLMKRFLFNQGGKSTSHLSMKVLATQSLMPKKFLSIVKVQNKYFLIGISENSINLIDKLDEFSEPEIDVNDEINKENSFLRLLKKNMIGR